MMKERIRQALARHPSQPIRDNRFRSSAVLVPLLEGDSWNVLFTKRTESLSHHKGQICFPGGSRDPDDPDLLFTAMRELHEELGVDPTSVEVLGDLDDYVTVSDFVITPFVGVLPNNYPFRVNRDEIAEVLEVPLSFFLDPKNCRREWWVRRNRAGWVYFYDYGQHTIWGVTAHILKNFIDIVFEGISPSPNR